MKTNSGIMEVLKGLESKGFEINGAVVKTPTGQLVSISDLEMVVESTVGNKTLEYKKVDGTHIAAQTFKMLLSPYGWDGALRNRYGYMDQFKVLVKELEVQQTIKRKANGGDVQAKEDFYYRNMFFNKDVAVSLCRNYMNTLSNYYNEHKYKEYRMVETKKHGWVGIEVDYIKLDNNHGTHDSEWYFEYRQELYSIFHNIENSKTFKDVITYLKEFMREMNKVPDKSPLCKEWREAYKGVGAYRTLIKIVKSYDLKVRGLRGEYAINLINNEVVRNSNAKKVWRIHYLLKEVIEENNLNLQAILDKSKV